MSAPAGRLVVRLTRRHGALQVEIARPAPLAADRLFLGRAPEEVARLAPLIWNACPGAQAAAARAALGLPVDAVTLARVSAEAVREHALALCLRWPEALRLPDARTALVDAARVDADPKAAERLRAAVFAPLAGAPEDWAQMRDWMAAGWTPAARCVAQAVNWPAASARADAPLFDPAAPPDWPAPLQRNRPVDNGLAALWVDVPLMREVEALRGRGPLWRMAARLLDFDRLLGEPDTPLLPNGAVRTARGLMLVRACVQGGRVARFERLSPTDFLLAPGGALDAATAALPAEPDAPLAPVARLTLALLDPCLPCAVEIDHA
jgi:hypothetical protein